jgi:hypothetical protein
MTWAEINRKRLPYIRMGEKLFKTMYNRLRKQLVDELKKAQDTNEMMQIGVNIQLDRAAVQEAMEKYYLRTSGDWAKMTAKAGGRKLETKQEDDWMAIILEYVRTKKGPGIESIIRTHGGDIENIVSRFVQEGISEGIGIEKIARNISKAQGEMDLWKALRIARTEVVNASNEGVKIGASELPGNKKKVWISTFDGRSREDHMAMDGVEIPMNEMFQLPTGSMLEYPGDSANGAPGDVINCRCAYEIIVEKESY